MTRSLRLIERGGIGLVMFHLAREGLEFALTGDCSDRGDIWVRSPSGQFMALEVKTSVKKSWHIKKAQIARVDIYALVSLDDATVFIFSSNDMRRLAADHGKARDEAVVVLASNTLPREAERAWHLLKADPAPARPKATPRPRLATLRVVRKRLASGEIREYHYPRAPGQTANSFTAVSETNETAPASI
jgi:hypothetical protein